MADSLVQDREFLDQSFGVLVDGTDLSQWVSRRQIVQEMRFGELGEKDRLVVHGGHLEHLGQDHIRKEVVGRAGHNGCQGTPVEVSLDPASLERQTRRNSSLFRTQNAHVNMLAHSAFTLANMIFK
jgi:hypothetical protein